MRLVVQLKFIHLEKAFRSFVRLDCVDKIVNKSLKKLFSLIVESGTDANLIRGKVCNNNLYLMVYFSTDPCL